MRAVALRQPLRFLRLLFSRGSARARSGNDAHNAPFPSLKAVKAPPRRGKAFWSAARFVCRMTLYACRSSSHKTRYAIFAGALKAKKALSRPFPKKSFASQNLFREPKTRGSRLVVRWNIGGKTEGVKYKAPEQLREKRSSAVSTARDGGLSKARRKGYRISTAP